MKPEDVDKLFNERLGKHSPTPSADLWSRLQTRIEDELPVKEEKKPIMMWARSYAAAAAITVLLSAGVVFYNVQQDAKLPSDAVSQTELPSVAEETPVTDYADRWVSKDIAVTDPELSETAEGVTAGRAEESMAVTESPVEASPEPAPAKKAEIREQLPVTTSNSTKGMYTAASEKPVRESEKNVSDEATTPVSFASSRVDMNAAPVEIIIKRSVAVQAPESEVETEPASDSKNRQQLVKNIFKQVKKLSNGEQINLSELGLNADRIALETQIGKQKISKVINL